MSVDLSQFLPTFLEESYEGLDIMESGLLNLSPGDDESIHAIFRAAHSIKGGAGTFGFMQVTEFTHLVETLLDEMRDGRREITQPDIEILLESVDCIRILIEAEKLENTCEDTKISETSNLLEATLKDKDSLENEVLEASTISSLSAPQWQITFVPEQHLVQTGNDPIFLFNALEDLGEVNIRCNTSALPPLDDLEPEDLHLSWVIDLTADCSEADIREIFEWVEDECELTVLPIESEVPLEDESVEVIAQDTNVTEAESSVVTSENTKNSINTSSESLPELTKTAEKPSNKATEKATTSKVKPEVGSIRVGVDKVDSLINLVGELVITQSMLSELGNDFEMSKVERLTSGLEQLLQNTKELQESVMRIRMLPISFAFNRFPRLIHDLSIKTGKSIELIITGEHTELDKTVMEQIGDPLVHLVRNAVDHGIEPTDVRLAAGKPEQGIISLDAFHQGGSIVIEISDDGGGIDREAVFNKAVEKGIVDNTTTLSDSQVFDLIFEPGFSTAQTLSDISGRGVGMDVVKRNIQSLGGRIQIESEKGKGSKIRVILPLTLAILDGQLVKVGSEIYIIPLISIVESLQVEPSLVNRISGDMVLYRLREDNVPVLPVSKIFNIDAENIKIDDALLVVVESDGQKIGLMVDDLLAQQQVVIKSLADNYQQVKGISGATILGDGSVAMILDIPSFIDMALKITQPTKKNKSSNDIALSHQSATGEVM